MKYVCLVYGEEPLMQTIDDRECVANGEALRQAGHYVAAESLQPVSTAATVRVRNGRVSVTDGPFAETKEVIAGFYLIEARDLEEATALAAKIPPARVGAIEVRPVRELAGVGTQPRARGSSRSPRTGGNASTWRAR
jgi:hypothetical protein